MNWSILASVMDTFSPQSENSWFFSSITGPIHIQTDTGFMTLQALHRQIVYLAFMSPLWQATYSHTRYLHTSLDPLNLVCPYWGKENTAWLVTFISPMAPGSLPFYVPCVASKILYSLLGYLPNSLAPGSLYLLLVCSNCGKQDTIWLVTFIPPWSLTLSA